jgi:hypothetical protein
MHGNQMKSSAGPFYRMHGKKKRKAYASRLTARWCMFYLFHEKLFIKFLRRTRESHKLGMHEKEGM